MSKPDTNQASDDEIIYELEQLQIQAASEHRSFEWVQDKLLNLIRTEKLRLLDEVMHQSTVNLKSAKAVAGWAELRKKQLEAEL